MNYYTHTCKCGCGEQIEIREYHKWYGIPEFLRGHYRDKKTLFILENKSKHFCQCGCGNEIEIKEYHKWKGIPLYISGHNGRKIKNKCLYEKCNNLVIKPSNKYCSHECYSLSLLGKASWNKGKMWDEEHRLKLSKIHTGKKLSSEHRQNIGKAFEGEKSHFYGVHNFGELAPNWQNGISKLPYAFDFTEELKQSIKDRDFNICQTPGCMNTENLHVHHIDYDKKNSSMDNLITLCISCHMKTNGKKKREYWTNYYQEILNVYL